MHRYQGLEERLSPSSKYSAPSPNHTHTHTHTHNSPPNYNTSHPTTKAIWRYIFIN